MSDGPDLGRVAALRTLSTAQRMMRCAILLAPIIVLATIEATTGSVYPPFAVVVVLLAGACAVAPDGHLGLLTLLLLAWYWVATVDHPTAVATLVTALAVLVFHTALAAATVAPPAARWSRSMLHRWGRRCGVVAAATAAAWGTSRLLSDTSIDGSAALLSIALLTLAGGAVWLRRRSLAR
jgi:hypothetical protein